MAHAEVTISLDTSGTHPQVVVDPDSIEITKNHGGIKWRSEYEFEIEIKDGSDLHFDMGKKSGKQKDHFNTKIREEHQQTPVPLPGLYTVRVFADGEVYEKDPDYIIRPRVRD